MTPFPYRAEDVHLTLRPTHQTREPVDDEYVEMMKDDLTATIPESDYGTIAVFEFTYKPYSNFAVRCNHQVGQVGYVAEP